FLFLLMLHLHPKSSLFPYTTLFRSVVDEMLNEVAPGEDGELVMAGPQVSPGYWRDAAQTAAAFVRLPGKQGTYYRTGDRVRRPRSEEHTSELQSRGHLVCRLLLEKK